MSTTQLTPEQIAENRGPQLAAVVIVLVIISTITIALRSYVRVFMSKSFGADDGMTIFAYINLVLYTAFVLNGIHYGTGRRAAALTPTNYSRAMESWWFAEIWYGTTSTLLRVSVSMLLLRLTTIKWQRLVLHAVIIVSVAMGVIITFTFIYQCQPIKFFWSPTRDPKDGTCMDFNVELAIIYAHGAVACLGDWTLGLLPWIMVRNLKMKRRLKVSVGLLLCLANFGSVATIVRFYCIKQVATNQDFLFATVDIAIWSALEIGTGIPACCLVTLRPLFRSYFGTSNGTNQPNSHVPSSGGYRGAAAGGYQKQEGGGANKAPSAVPMTPLGGAVTTTIVSNDKGSRANTSWLKKGASSDSSSDEQPLQPWQIMRDQEIGVEFTTNARR